MNVENLLLVAHAKSTSRLIKSVSNDLRFKRRLFVILFPCDFSCWEAFLAVLIGEELLLLKQIWTQTRRSDMHARALIIAALLSSIQSWSAIAGEPVARGSFHTLLLLGDKCLSVPKTDVRPGACLEMRPCQNSADQIFEWNVTTFEIKIYGLCVDAFPDEQGHSRPGDQVGLWYCQQTRHQKWYTNHENSDWLGAFNIVGGSGPDSELCLDILDIVDGKSADRSQLALWNCHGGANQWFRLHPWPPSGGAS